MALNDKKFSLELHWLQTEQLCDMKTKLSQGVSAFMANPAHSYTEVITDKPTQQWEGHILFR